MKQSTNNTEIIGRAPKIHELKKLAQTIGQTDMNVLITGETGTGKDLFARTIHGHSKRAEAPYVPVNCAAIPDTLVENELFGHEKGAYTGAVNATPGFFISAQNGTLFLDEITELQPASQAKILRVLEDGIIHAIGHVKPKQVDVRIIAAFNHDPESVVKDGKLRKDLFFRLSMAHIHLPPIRDHKEDIPLLCDYYRWQYTLNGQVAIRDISSEILDCFDIYDWPGNIRELKQVMEYAVNMATVEYSKVIEINHLPVHFQRSILGSNTMEANGYHDLNLKAGVKRLRTRYMRQALVETGGNKLKAAQLLGISRPAFYKFMAVNQIDHRGTID